ncbi:tail fiber domain-containing protein [Sphingobacterium shayense]|uniref:tail fiber domain-containing protein n=1 Tax=Sphingobacterium shayense TaxID=626343 RepID=UPI0015521079|nr:tail fiber domain-containing protein [Sphingobacterium shayense]NQD71857.1 tail fiber domain-containing protein [Sphingobacterium shayense]
MNNKIKSGIALLLTLCAYQIVSAQQIEEKDLKINIQEIGPVASKISALTPISYTYNTKDYKKLALPKETQYGFLTEQVSSVFPHLVKPSSKIYTESKNSTKVAKLDEVDQNELIPLLVAAIKEQQEQIEDLKEQIDALKAK